MIRRVVPAALALGLLVAGCGGGGGGKSSPTTAADWANGYCSATATWVSAFQSARASVKAGTGEKVASLVDNAVSSVSAATTTFTLALGKLGTPDTPDGATSEATAKHLGNLVQGRVARAAAATQTNNANVTDAQRTSVVKTQATLAFGDVAATTAKLAKDDPALGTAMKASSACATLNADLAKEKA